MESWSPNGATATEKEMDGERGLVGWILEVADENGEHLRSPVGMEVTGGNGGRHFRSVSLKMTLETGEKCFCEAPSKPRHQPNCCKTYAARHRHRR
nr:hypothetical protein Iba_scaffold668483CG0010 [Ipomoea batatas]GMC74669.1 hypothetical protein Iba_chr03cCG12280 [Ipomoea batatas]GMD14204.1 hypothetical protein Iba_scaffold40757CG0010 [Ipomoea batatas]GMD19353.1 hypothetical protein Iba_chr07eCG7440 [Ipomoea batatas]GMD24076.1 hypothetical protein Iba_chr08bCG11300 [Ipomoea batatas]